MTYSLLLAKRYHNLKFQELSKESLINAKQCLIDYLGCTLAGVPYESSNIVREFSYENYTRGTCTVIGSKKKLVPAGAAFTNGTTGHATELDDCTNEGGGHPGVTIIPVALAMAEYSGQSGKDVLRAIVIGYDTFIRIGKAANYDSCFARGFHPTALFGMFAAAMTASTLMKLSTDKTTNAMGIVGSYAAGNLECYADGSYTKRLQPGIAASSGVTAAMLAAKGFTGPKTILEGPRGFYHAYCDGARPEDLAKNNALFEIESISFKPHACCRFNQAAIDAVLEILYENHILTTSIESILVELPERPYNIVGQPQEVKFNPKNAVDGQFSAPYSVAIAAIEKRALLQEYTEETVVRSDVRKLMKKISVKHAHDLDGYFPESFPTRLTLTTNDGKSFIKEVRYPKGDPQNPLTWDELLQKFSYCVSGSLTAIKSGRIIDMVRNLEKMQDTRELMKLLH
jgi:2-methylcitrate dehydratase PrpD